MENSDIYLRATMSLIARNTFPPEKLAEVISPVANVKTYETYNLFDGTRTQTDIAKIQATDASLLSRTVKRWIDDGIMVKIVDAGAVKPVHVYPLPDRYIEAARKKIKGKSNGRRTDRTET
nr:hypothetical protein [Mesorhizobium loti]